MTLGDRRRGAIVRLHGRRASTTSALAATTATLVAHLASATTECPRLRRPALDKTPSAGGFSRTNLNLGLNLVDTPHKRAIQDEQRCDKQISGETTVQRKRDCEKRVEGFDWILQEKYLGKRENFALIE